MRTRQKTVYILTIVAIAAFCVMAGTWLSTQYRASLQLQADQGYAAVLEAMKEQQEIRHKAAKKSGLNITVAIHKDSLSTYVDAYLSDRTKLAQTLDTIKFVDMRPYGEVMHGFEHRRIDFEGSPSYDAVQQAATQYLASLHSPFSAALMDSLLNERGIVGAEILTEKTDSMQWEAEREDCLSLFNPQVKVVAPYDTFNRGCAVISVPLSGSAIFSEMRVLLAMTVIVALLLIYCFLYQLLTIRKLREIDTLREEMMHKLIQERLREQSLGRNGQFQLGRLVFDTNNNCIFDGDEATHLTVRQSDILSLLTENLGSIVPRNEILKTIWGDDSTANSLSLNVQLSHLRKILSADPRVTIVTVKGKGLMMNVEKNQSTTV